MSRFVIKSDPTDHFYENVCLSYRHDFGLLSQEEKEKLMYECKEWFRAIRNNADVAGLPRDKSRSAHRFPEKFSVMFSINRYDYEGDIIEEGIFLHFDNTSMKIGESLDDLDNLIFTLASIREEISENY